MSVSETLIDRWAEAEAKKTNRTNNHSLRKLENADWCLVCPAVASFHASPDSRLAKLFLSLTPHLDWTLGTPILTTWMADAQYHTPNDAALQKDVSWSTDALCGSSSGSGGRSSRSRSGTGRGSGSGHGRRSGSGN